MYKKCIDCGKQVSKKGYLRCKACNIRKNNKFGLPDEWRKNISKSLICEKNPMWRGDSVGNKALHMWVRKRKKKPLLCEICKKEAPRDLANKGTYDRDLDNWEWLCRRCHMIKDGRMKELDASRKKNAENFKGKKQTASQVLKRTISMRKTMVSLGRWKQI